MSPHPFPTYEHGVCFVEKRARRWGTAILAVGLAGILPADKRAKQQARCLSSPQAGSLCPSRA